MLNKRMKIVILNTSERTGGAAVAAGRLGKALERVGILVEKLVILCLEEERLS